MEDRGYEGKGNVGTGGVLGCAVRLAHVHFGTPMIGRQSGLSYATACCDVVGRPKKLGPRVTVYRLSY